MTAVALPTHTPSARHLVGLPLSAASVSLCTSPCPMTTENWSLPAAKDRAHSERTRERCRRPLVVFRGVDGHRTMDTGGRRNWTARSARICWPALRRQAPTTPFRDHTSGIRPFLHRKAKRYRQELHHHYDMRNDPGGLQTGRVGSRRRRLVPGPRRLALRPAIVAPGRAVRPRRRVQLSRGLGRGRA